MESAMVDTTLQNVLERRGPNAFLALSKFHRQPSIPSPVPRSAPPRIVDKDNFVMPPDGGVVLRRRTSQQLTNDIIDRRRSARLSARMSTNFDLLARRTSLISMESGCSNVTLEQHEKEWIIKASQGDLESLTRLLLTDHKLVEFRDFITGYTGLHWACKLSRLDMAKVLLDGGSKVNTASHSGQTALHLAAQSGNSEMIELLLRYVAAQSGNSEMIELLMRYVAAQSGNSEMIELLLRYDADKEQRDYRGRKPGQYLSPNADCQAKTLLSLPQSVSVSQQQGSRKASKAMTLGSDGFAENTPKRTHTINQAWKKLKGPSFKTSFASKKSKKDTHKSERLTSPRTETKENRQLGAQTLPAHVARTMPANYF
eukprot:sb/3465834/